MVTCGISKPFGSLSPASGQVAYVLRDRSPLTPNRSPMPVRLAFLRHAASVRPEPGSNSPTRKYATQTPRRNHDQVRNELAELSAKTNLVPTSPLRALKPRGWSMPTCPMPGCYSKTGTTHTQAPTKRLDKRCTDTYFFHCSVVKVHPNGANKNRKPDKSVRGGLSNPLDHDYDARSHVF